MPVATVVQVAHTNLVSREENMNIRRKIQNEKQNFENHDCSNIDYGSMWSGLGDKH